jgi:ABC-2 type transport system permease protein
MIRDNLRILRQGAVSSMADLRATYTWRTWTFAWLARILCQVAMFALIGRLLGPDKTAYLLIGNAVFVAVPSVMLVCSSIGWERMIGTVPLLVASPAPTLTVFAGRNVHWLLDGVTCSTVSLFTLGPLFGVSLPMPVALLAVPLIAVTAIAVYCFALTLGGLVLRLMRLRVLAGNLGGLTLMVLTGVQVPTTFWPTVLQYVTAVLPVTHGLAAVRTVLAGGAAAEAGRLVFLELAVGGLWLGLAYLAFRWLHGGGRRDGSLEFGA